jgi:pimeloyl-ACP methyl ester carboxylesterase
MVRFGESFEAGFNARMTATYFQANSIRLHAIQTGPEAGPLVIILHGFPEFWYGWRGQVEPLARAGFR